MHDNRYQSVRIVLWVILFANFAVAAIKTVVGIWCRSQSVIADGIHSFADGASNIVGLIGIWLASKPRDEKHPYGHEKYEILASLSIGIMLAVMAVRIMSRAVLSFQNTGELAINLTEGFLMGLTIFTNSVVAFLEFRWGKRLNSTIQLQILCIPEGTLLFPVRFCWVYSV